MKLSRKALHLLTRLFAAFSSIYDESRAKRFFERQPAG